MPTGRKPSKPSLQNIPVRTELGKQIRKAFFGEANPALLAGNYDQLEMRCMAQIQEDIKKATNKKKKR